MEELVVRLGFIDLIQSWPVECSTYLMPALNLDSTREIAVPHLNAARILRTDRVGSNQEKSSRSEPHFRRGALACSRLWVRRWQEAFVFLNGLSRLQISCDRHRIGNVRPRPGEAKRSVAWAALRNLRGRRRSPSVHSSARKVAQAHFPGRPFQDFLRADWRACFCSSATSSWALAQPIKYIWISSISRLPGRQPLYC